jgi:hypothetical protein
MVGTKGRFLFNLRERQSTRMKLTRSLSFVTYAHAGAGGASAAALAAPRGRHRIQRSVLGRGRRLCGPGEEKTAFFFRFACRFKQRSFCQHRLQTEIILPRQASDRDHFAKTGFRQACREISFKKEHRLSMQEDLQQRIMALAYAMQEPLCPHARALERRTYCELHNN